jgi:L-threonylcarbamoyladenylate synthase
MLTHRSAKQVTLLLPINSLNPAPEVLARAASALRQGKVVAYPTETLYGLGVDPFDEDALERLYRLKGRPSTRPVSILVRDVAMLREVTHDLPGSAIRLIEAFLPGPLTLVLPASPRLPQRLTAGTGRIGVRISAHPLIGHLFSSYPAPITTTSANPTGAPNAGDAKKILSYFPQGIDCILDAGSVPGGIGSTVVEATGDAPAILREGAISEEAISEALR